METILLVVAIVLAAAGVFTGILNLLRRPIVDTSALERRLLDELRATRQETAAAVDTAVRAAAQVQADTQRRLDERQDTRLRELREQLAESQAALQRAVTAQMAGLDERLGKFTVQNEQKLENIRRTMEERVGAMQAGNERKLEEMRQTVDEKLQKTLDERLKQSFGMVRESLDKVQHGLGEMQSLANGVGDLKRVLSNVKTRGILGEIQLGAILEEILAPGQYAANVETVRGSGMRVEYAVKLPGAGEGESVWLPIDAKFPSDAYAALLDAYDAGDAAAVEAAAKTLENRILMFGQDIQGKYIRTPETTDFGIMFLPVEGLYAEVVRRGLVEKLQARCKVNIAGPTTLAALLNSLQMGFKTLAIQKSSGEVMKVLEEVRTEFEKFGDQLQKAKERIDMAGREMDTLIGTRTNQMRRKLNGVTRLAGLEEESLPAAEAGGDAEGAADI